MKAKLFDRAIVSDPEQAVDFIGNILEASTEYSIIGKDLDGKSVGTFNHVRKSGERFIARVVLTPRRDGQGKRL